MNSTITMTGREYDQITNGVNDLRAENERLRACLRHIGEIAENAAQGRESVSHWWYGEEVWRALNLPWPPSSTAHKHPTLQAGEQER